MNRVVSFFFISFLVTLSFKAHSQGDTIKSIKACLEAGGTPIERFGSIFGLVIVECQMPEQEEKDDWGIIEDTLKCTDCLRWRAKGVCFWITIHVFPPSVEINESLLVEHYLPDFVVAAYSTTSPFEGITEEFTDKPLAPIENDSERITDYDTNLDFKHADVFVNPAIPVYEALARTFEYSCQSVEKIPYLPKFLSQHDFAWKNSTLERFTPQALLGFPRMSALPEYWGPIYPRDGWTSLPFDALSAVVIAERASEIVTGFGLPHVHIPAGSDCGDRCWPPPPVEVGNNDNRFQQIFPDDFVEDGNHHLPRNGSWARGREDLYQKYAWVLWRKYECCAKNGQAYIGRITW